MTFIPIASPVIGERELAYVSDAVRSGWVSSIGAYIGRFEKLFAEYIGVSNAIAVGNGTVALHLALHSLGIGPGDEVIVPDLTFVATVHAVIQTGATPVLVDVESDTWCLDPTAVERAITPRTRAIIPVHLYGHPADMPALQQIADQNQLILVEDAAEAHGAEINGKRVGSLGRIGTFSFYGNKIITTGEGGILTTNDDSLAERLRLLKDHGMSSNRRYYHTELAFNYRMTNMQAALGVAQMEQIDEFIAKKRSLYYWYSEVLGGRQDMQLNIQRDNVKNVYWLISLVLTPVARIDRQDLMNRLRQLGIDTRPFFIPMHKLPHLAHYRTVGCQRDNCPQSEYLGMKGFSLPSGCNLDEETVNYVASTVAELINRG